jgi:hypothetical protein
MTELCCYIIKLNVITDPKTLNRRLIFENYFDKKIFGVSLRVFLIKFNGTDIKDNKIPKRA